MIYLGLVEKKRRDYFHLLLHLIQIYPSRQLNQKAFVHSTIQPQIKRTFSSRFYHTIFSSVKKSQRIISTISF